MSLLSHFRKPVGISGFHFGGPSGNPRKLYSKEEVKITLGKINRTVFKVCCLLYYIIIITLYILCFSIQNIKLLILPHLKKKKKKRSPYCCAPYSCNRPTLKLWVQGNVTKIGRMGDRSTMHNIFSVYFWGLEIKSYFL